MPQEGPQRGGRDRHFGLPARRDPQETPRGPQEAPKRPPRGLKRPPGSPQKRPRGPQHCPKKAPGWLETPHQSVTASSGQHGNPRNAFYRHLLICCSFSQVTPICPPRSGFVAISGFSPTLRRGSRLVSPRGVWGGPLQIWPRPRAEGRQKPAEVGGRRRPTAVNMQLRLRATLTASGGSKIASKTASERRRRPQDGPKALQEGPRWPQDAPRGSQEDPQEANTVKFLWETVHV